MACSLIELTIPLGYLERETNYPLDLTDATIVQTDDLDSSLRENICTAFKELQACKLIDFPFPDFCLQTHLPALENVEEARRLLDRALTTFKLFKGAHVLSNLAFFSKDGKMTFRHWRHYFHWRRCELTAFFLGKGEEIAFKKFWNEFAEINTENFAVYRFHLADFRPYLRDRFVDHVESLEYLFVPDSDEHRIGYKFRSRGTMVLGEHLATEERVDLFKQLKDAYDLRSAIVHGNTTEESRLLPSSDLWEERIEIVRRHNIAAIKLLFRAGVLDNYEKRKAFMKTVTLDSKTAAAI